MGKAEARDRAKEEEDWEGREQLTESGLSRFYTALVPCAPPRVCRGALYLHA